MKDLEKFEFTSYQSIFNKSDIKASPNFAQNCAIFAKLAPHIHTIKVDGVLLPKKVYKENREESYQDLYPTPAPE